MTKTLERNAILTLVTFFKRNGCFRVPDQTRRKRENQEYKKGYEVRLTANSDEELKQILQSLEILGFQPGKPYSKINRTIVPIYGKMAVVRFKDLLPS